MGYMAKRNEEWTQCLKNGVQFEIITWSAETCDIPCLIQTHIFIFKPDSSTLQCQCVYQVDDFCGLIALSHLSATIVSVHKKFFTTSDILTHIFLIDTGRCCTTQIRLKCLSISAETGQIDHATECYQMSDKCKIFHHWLMTGNFSWALPTSITINAEELGPILQPHLDKAVCVLGGKGVGGIIVKCILPTCTYYTLAPEIGSSSLWHLTYEKLEFFSQIKNDAYGRNFVTSWWCINTFHGLVLPSSVTFWNVITWCNINLGKVLPGFIEWFAHYRRWGLCHNNIWWKMTIY